MSEDQIRQSNPGGALYCVECLLYSFAICLGDKTG